MEHIRQMVSEAVDAKPWATLGFPPEAAGMSLDLCEHHHHHLDHPWHANDVEPEPSTPNRIPARQRHRRLHPYPRPRPRPHPISRHRDNTTTTSRVRSSTPVRLLWTTGPSPLTSPAPASWDSQTTQGQLRSSPVGSPANLTTRASTCTAHLELLNSTRRAMDYFNDVTEYARTSYSAAAQTADSVWRALTSRTAQRTLVTTVLFALVSAVLFAVACVGYLAFYHNYLPDQVVSLPVHLQYGYAINPYGVVSLADARFAAYQDYDISVTLHLPRSPANLDRGNFMIALHLLDDAPAAAADGASVPAPVHILQGRHILHTSTRAAIVPYTDPLVSLASRVLFLAYHIFVPASEAISLTVPLVERLEFRPGAMSPTWLVVDVQAGQTLQVYSATVTITAQLGGLRWFMHTWRVSAFVLFTTAFWACEVFFFAASFVVLRLLLFGGSSPLSSNDSKKIKDEQQQQQQQQGQQQHQKRIKQEAEEDVPMTFPTSSGQQPLRYEPAPAASNGANAPPADMPPALGGEADDEYEDAGQDYEAEEERARDSGIGTSYSERDSSALRRRTSRGRIGG